MEKIILIICIGIVIIGIIAIILITQYNNFQLLLIKLNKGEVNLQSLFVNKYNILLRYIEFLKEKIEINEEEIEEYNYLNTKQSIYKLNDKIESMNNIINKYMTNNEKLLNEETVNIILKELQEVNININGCKKYYNNNLVYYNHLCKKFPSNLVAKLFKYKEKDFLEEGNNPKLKILNNEKIED